MMASLLIALSLMSSTAFGLTAVTDYTSRYDGVKVLRVPTIDNAKAFNELVDSFSLQRWKGTRSHVDVEVPSDKYDDFVNAVNSLYSNSTVKDIKIMTMHEDLGASIKEESTGLFEAARVTSQEGRVGVADDAWFNKYHSLADHVQFLNDLVESFPNNSLLVDSGKSGLGIPITGINIFGSGGSGSKPAVVIHGTVHAREWIGTMVAEHFAYSLLANHSTADPEVSQYVEDYDFYIFPFVNPDGFNYTQTEDRLWRKTRSAPPEGSDCYGVDINRNWAHSAWGQKEGADTDPCSDAYKGSSAASLPETKALAAFLDEKASSDAGAKYMDLHSYSQLFMSPYGYTCDKNATDVEEHNKLTSGFADALAEVYGTKYETGPICQTIYVASGSSVDYAYDNAGYKYSFTPELRDTGEYGFVLPANQILPTAIETWAGFTYLLANIQ